MTNDDNENSFIQKHSKSMTMKNQHKKKNHGSSICEFQSLQIVNHKSIKLKLSLN
jgi:phosphotransferase system HPr-like phosphotransfer protein